MRVRSGLPIAVATGNVYNPLERTSKNEPELP